MNRSILVRAVGAQLGRYKRRTALATAGIALGVLAMVAIQALAVGARAGFVRFVEFAYPADVIVLAAGDLLSGGSRGRDALTLDDVAAVRAAIPEIVDWDPVVRAGGRDLERRGADVRVPIFGHSERAEGIKRRGVREGEFFDAVDVAARGRVLLLGSSTARLLFGAESPIGAELFVDTLSFTVKGVLEPVGVDPHGTDLDQTAWMPFTTAMESLLRIDYLAEAAFSIGDPARAEHVAERIASVMREEHAIPAGFEDDFSIATSNSVRDRLDWYLGIFATRLAILIAALFGIAGVVVASVLAIAVKQRAAEIGVRKALGATRADLAMHLGIEVLAMALIAAAIGLAGAFALLAAVAPLLAEQFGMQAIEIAPWAAAASIAAAVATAAVGAAWPLWRAARLDPVDALR